MQLFRSFIGTLNTRGNIVMHLYGLQHPDNPLMEEAVDEVVKRFHVQMDHVPRISLYDSDKGVALEVPRESFRKYTYIETESV